MDAGVHLQEIYWHLCDALGITIQAATALGFVTCAVLMLGLLARVTRDLLLFLLSTAGVFTLYSLNESHLIVSSQ